MIFKGFSWMLRGEQIMGTEAGGPGGLVSGQDCLTQPGCPGSRLAYPVMLAGGTL